MRTAFITTLTEMAAQDRNIYLITGDVGFSVFENFARQFPERFFNLGIAESNLIGVAAGLAMSGKNVYVYSMVPFITMRCFEQIRMDLCYQKVGVKIVGVGGGFSYGPAGASHHSIEDLAIMRALPGMIVLAPGDPVETQLATQASARYNDPVYFRLGKNGEPIIHERTPDFQIGKALIIKEGTDLSLIATGNMLESAFHVWEKLSQKGLNARLISMHTVKPIDQSAILDCLGTTRYLFTIEEHSIIGGLGSAVAEIVAENTEFHTPLKRIGIADQYPEAIGSQEYLREKTGLAVEQICGTILNLIGY